MVPSAFTTQLPLSVLGISFAIWGTMFPCGSVYVRAELKVTASSLKAVPPGAAIFGDSVGGSPAQAMRMLPRGPDCSGLAACPPPRDPPGEPVGAAQAASTAAAMMSPVNVL